jgi:hypothetical protein
MDRLLDFGLPGLVFLALVVWLVRKAIRAARTESDLEAERLSGALADELRAAKAQAAAATQRGPRLVTPPPEPLEPPASRLPLDGADTRGASAEHVRIVGLLAAEREASLRASESGPSDVARRVEVLWVRSTETHVAWCEVRHPATRAAAGMARSIICVARVEDGQAIERWAY